MLLARSVGALLLCSSLLGGCLYSFTGGGLPRHIRTIAIAPFENTTAQPLLSSELQLALQDELPRSLGVRLVDEAVADAVVRGRVVQYSEDSPNVRAAQPGERAILQQRVTITLDATIYDLREDRQLWSNGSLSGIGTFQPGDEQFTAGRTRAIEELVRKMIDGAQSQW